MIDPNRRVRLSVDITAQQKEALLTMLPHGSMKLVFSAFIDALIAEYVEKGPSAVTDIIKGKLAPSELVKRYKKTEE